MKWRVRIIVSPIYFGKLLNVSNLIRVYAIIFYSLVPIYNQLTPKNLKNPSDGA